MKSSEVREIIEKAGYAISGNVTKDQLAQAYESMQDGASNEDLLEMYPWLSRAPEQPQPPAAPPQEQQAALPLVPTTTISLTPEDLQRIIESATTAAVTAALKSVQREPAATAPAVKKPTYPSKADVPAEFFDKAGLTIYASGTHHTLDGFLVDGRWIPCPRSILILFTNVPGYNAQRFGDSVNIQYVCRYHTHDKREIDMFKADERWGTMYWDGSGRMNDSAIELGSIMVRKMSALAGAPFDTLRQLCKDRGIPLGTLESMRAAIAAFDARKDLRDQAEAAAKRLDEANKQTLLLEGIKQENTAA
jgi:hypothetical protein